MALLPTTQQVAQLMWWRTRARVNAGAPGGALVADFTDDTTPTAAIAQAIIATTPGLIVDVTGALTKAEADLPDELDAAITSTLAWQAAAAIEASMPNTDADKLAWLQEMATAAKTALSAAIKQFLDTGETGLEAASGEYVVPPLVFWPPTEIMLSNRTFPAWPAGYPVGAYGSQVCW